MKTQLIGMALVLIAIATNAQVKKSDATPEKQKQDAAIRNNGTAHRIVSSITGKITYPKSIGAIPDFETKVKSAIKLYSYKIISGQLQEKKAIDISVVKILNATRSEGANYIYTFEIQAVMPYGQPIEIEIPADWSLPSGKHFFISKTDPGEYATLSADSRVYSGFDFTGRDAWHPH